MAVALLAVGLMSRSGTARAQESQPFAGPPTRLLIVGSPHLSQIPTKPTAAELSPVLDRLASWTPELIAVEALSGAQCDLMRRHADRFGEMAESYCWNPAPAAASTGLDVAAAEAAVRRTLASSPAEPTPGD